MGEAVVAAAAVIVAVVVAGELESMEKDSNEQEYRSSKCIGVGE